MAITANIESSIRQFEVNIGSAGMSPTPPGGEYGSIQFNNNGQFGGVTGFTFNAQTGTIQMPTTEIDDLNVNTVTAANTITAENFIGNGRSVTGVQVNHLIAGDSTLTLNPQGEVSLFSNSADTTTLTLDAQGLLKARGQIHAGQGLVIGESTSTAEESDGLGVLVGNTGVRQYYDASANAWVMSSNVKILGSVEMPNAVFDLNQANIGDLISNTAEVNSATVGQLTTTNATFGNIAVTGNQTIGGNLDIAGDITLAGNLVIGNQNVDTVTVIADFTSNLIPNDDAAYNLGTAEQRWNQLNAQDVISANLHGNIATTTIGNIRGVDIDANVTATVTQGSNYQLVSDPAVANFDVTGLNFPLEVGDLVVVDGGGTGFKYVLRRVLGVTGARTGIDNYLIINDQVVKIWNDTTNNTFDHDSINYRLGERIEGSFVVVDGQFFAAWAVFEATGTSEVYNPGTAIREHYTDSTLAHIQGLVQAVEYLDDKVIMLRSNTDSNLSAEVTSLSTNLAQLRSDTDSNLSTAVTEINSNVANVQAELTANTITLTDAITTLRSNTDSNLSTAVDSINSNVANVQAELSANTITLSTAIDTLRSDTDSNLTAAVDAINSNVANVSAELATNTATLTTAIGTLRSDTDSNLSVAVDAINSNVANVQAELSANTATLTTAIDTLRSDTDSNLGAAVDSINSNVANVSAELATNTAILTTAIETLRSNTDSNLTTAVDSINSNVANVQAELATNTATLTTAIDTLRANTDSNLTTAVDSINSNVANVSAELSANTATLTTAIDTLRANTDSNLSTAVTEINSNVANVQAELATNTATLTTAIETAESNAAAYTDTQVSTAIANLVASAPNTLDTLNEIAVALGNDANLSVTLTNLIAAAESNIANVSSDLTTAVETLRANTDSNLSTAVTEINSNVANVSAELATNTATLTTAVETLRANTDSNLTTAVDSVNSNVANVQAELAANTATLTTAIATAESNAAANLSTAVTEINSNVGNVQAELAANTATLTTDIATLRSNTDSNLSTAIDSINNKFAALNEPTGFPDSARTLTTITFDSSQRQFTISPTGTEFSVWVQGTEYVKTAESVIIPAVTGLYYIYYNNAGVLTASTTAFNLETQAPVALVYWANPLNQATYFADERHGTSLDWQTHEYLHRTRGTVVASGFDVVNYTDSNIQLASGTMYDEDIEFNLPGGVITHQPYYRLTQGGETVWAAGTATDNFGTAQYNLNTAGVWSLAATSTGRYSVRWIVATNSAGPVKYFSIYGQQQYDNLSKAQAAQYTDLDLSGLPLQELRVLYKIIRVVDSQGAATVAAVEDHRGVNTTTVVVSHTPAADIEFRSTPETVFAADASTDVAWTSVIRNRSNVATIEASITALDQELSANTANLTTAIATLRSNTDSNLSTAVSAVNSNVANVQAELTTNTATLTTAIATLRSNTDSNLSAAVSAVNSNVANVTAELAANTATLTTAIATLRSNTDSNLANLDTELRTVIATAEGNAVGYTDNLVAQAVANLVANAPAALDTLNEISQALGADANLSTTLTTLIGAAEANIVTTTATLTNTISNLESTLTTAIETNITTLSNTLTAAITAVESNAAAAVANLTSELNANVVTDSVTANSANLIDTTTTNLTVTGTTINLGGSQLSIRNTDQIWPVEQGGDGLPMNSVALGTTAINQGVRAIAIGMMAGNLDQQPGAIAIGEQAGNINQGYLAVAVGSSSAKTNQGQAAVAIGNNSGNDSQGQEAVAVGRDTGSDHQGKFAVAVGRSAGTVQQGESAVAIGNDAGYLNQGRAAVAIGWGAGYLNQHDHTVVISAREPQMIQTDVQANTWEIVANSVINTTQANSFYLDPIRDISNDAQSLANVSGVLNYNAVTREVTWSQTSATVTGDVVSGNVINANSITTTNLAADQITANSIVGYSNTEVITAWIESNVSTLGNTIANTEANLSTAITTLRSNTDSNLSTAVNSVNSNVGNVQAELTTNTQTLTTAIATLRSNTDSNLSSAISAINSNVANVQSVLNTNTATLSTAIATLRSNTDSNLSTAIATLRSNTDSNLSTAIESVNSNVANVQSALNTNTQTLTTAVTTLRANTDSNLSQAITTLSNAIVVAEANATAYTNQRVANAVANLVASAPTTLDTLNEIAAALGNDPNLSATLTTLIGNVQSNLNTNTTAIYSNIATTRDAINSNVTAVNTAVTAVTATAANNAGNITTLQGNVVALTAATANNSSNITTLQGNVTTLAATLANNSSNITTLQGNVVALTAATANNSSNITTLTATVANNTSNITVLQGNINNIGSFLNKNLPSIPTDIGDLTDTYSKLGLTYRNIGATGITLNPNATAVFSNNVVGTYNNTIETTAREDNGVIYLRFTTPASLAGDRGVIFEIGGSLNGTLVGVRNEYLEVYAGDAAQVTAPAVSSRVKPSTAYTAFIEVLSPATTNRKINLYIWETANPAIEITANKQGTFVTGVNQWFGGNQIGVGQVGSTATTTTIAAAFAGTIQAAAIYTHTTISGVAVAGTQGTRFYDAQWPLRNNAGSAYISTEDLVAYTGNIGAGNINIRNSVITSTTGAGQSVVIRAANSEAYFNDWGLELGNASLGGNIRALGTVSTGTLSAGAAIPSANLTGNVGSTTRYWNTVFANAIVSPTITAIEGNITTLQGNVTTLRGNVTTLEGNVVSLTSTAANTAANVTTLQGNVVSLTSTAANTAANVTTLQGNVVSLTSTAANTAANVTTLQGNVVSLTSTAANTAANVTTLQGNVVSLTATAANTAANVTTLQGNVTTLRGNVTTLEGNVTALDTEVATLSGIDRHQVYKVAFIDTTAYVGMSVQQVAATIAPMLTSEAAIPMAHFNAVYEVTPQGTALKLTDYFIGLTVVQDTDNFVYRYDGADFIKVFDTDVRNRALLSGGFTLTEGTVVNGRTPYTGSLIGEPETTYWWNDTQGRWELTDGTILIGF
jgi:chromosome segregation ATPase